MAPAMRPRVIQVERSSKGFGLSLIYRGLDKYEEKDTGIFVARVVPGGQAARYGVREGDKIISINNKNPRNVDDAVGIIKEAGKSIKLMLLRQEEVPDVVHDDNLSLASTEMDSTWMRASIGQPGSRTGSVRSFNTQYGRHTPENTPAMIHNSPQQQKFLQEQEEYRRRQQQEIQAAQEAEAQRQYEQQIMMHQQQLRAQQQQQQQAELLAQQQQLQQQQLLQQQQIHESPVKQTVRDLINKHDPDILMKQNANYLAPTPRYTKEEITKSTENITTVESGRKSPGAFSTKSSRYKSTISLADLGLDNYPYPEMPESSRLSRKEEKQTLQNLNNRLAGYIDKVRQLQRDNAKLNKQIKHIEEYQSKEVTNVKQIYDHEIDSLKDALDGLSRQYNQLKVASEGLLSENEDLKDTLQRKDNDLKNTGEVISGLQDEIRQLTSRLGDLDNQRKKTQDRLDEVLPELQRQKDKLNEAKKQLDDEVLKKAELENQCQRLDEELKFKIQLLEQQLEEVKTRKEIEITEMDGKLQEEYEDRLQKALGELREVYDKQMSQNREDFAKLYETRVNDLQTHLASERGRASSGAQALSESKSRIENLVHKVSELESSNLKLNQKISDLAQTLEDQNSAQRSQLAAKDDEIKRLLDELSNQLNEYQTLMDTKVALDMEIAVFRRLLESEEDRLGIHIGDDSFDDEVDDDLSEVQRVITTNSESNFQRKITVSQTQL
ncbi:lamin-L(I) [Eurytemora carolleeae]|uniref:lamin-L(I) n=1 Tax=Eurytemora carolleeae TaxID=1294199 RepID=UPI000C789229|nr:lamin-L(I) [Eurytemora carolleeae]|eukprot:XP_023346890.1 lamin-L(I)-like [Eurytemora affinis]